jgi:hypothetical protein
MLYRHIKFGLHNNNASTKDKYWIHAVAMLLFHIQQKITRKKKDAYFSRIYLHTSLMGPRQWRKCHSDVIYSCVHDVVIIDCKKLNLRYLGVSKFCENRLTGSKVGPNTEQVRSASKARSQKAHTTNSSQNTEFPNWNKPFVSFLTSSRRMFGLLLYPMTAS